MVKRWLTCLLALLLVLSMTLTSLVVYADEEVVSGNDGTTEETPPEQGGDSQGSLNNAAPNNKGASESLEGFELVSSDNDDPRNLDLYFYQKEFAFKVVQKDADGNILKVWSSQLLPQDLGIDPDLPIEYAEEKSKELTNAPTDKKYNELNRVISQVEGKVESNYEPEAWKEMQAALETAKEAWNSTDDDEIKSAVTLLRAAISTLNKKKKPLRSSVFTFDKQSMSLFIINYVNLGNKVTTTEYSTTSYEQPKQLVGEVVKTGNGVSFVVNFPKLNINIPITVEVDGQELNVTIPEEGIYENLEGAKEVQEASDRMEELVDEINSLIEKTKKLVPKTKEYENERKDIVSKFAAVTGDLQIAKEAVLTGSLRSVNSADVLAKMAEVKERFKKYYEMFEGVEENTLKISDLLDECLKNYDIIAAEIATGIYTLKVMPFMGSATITESGYVFYPDGAGAISYFDRPHPFVLGQYNQPVYMDHIFNLEYMWNDTISNASLFPVWGVNKGKHGFVAIIDKGDVDANIEYWPGNENYVLNRVFSSFMIRRKSKYIKGTATMESYELQRIACDRKIKYIFLEEGKADYSAMANAYRDYLKENEMLNQAIKEDEKMPLAVDFLAGIKVQEVLWESTIPMTPYAQIQATIEKLREDGVTSTIYSNIYDWTKQSYNPNPLNADKALGGKKELLALTQYATENNVIMGLAVNPVWAQKDYATGAEMNRYFVRDETTLLVNYNNSTYVYSPAYMKEKYASKIISKLKDYGANCAQLNAIGTYLYYDHSSYYNTITSRADTAQIFAEIAKLSNEELGYSSVSGANMFMWKYASRIDSMPLSDIEYLFSDESVPFLQMVLHGSIPYSGGVPYNVMYDDSKQKLEYIEFGCMPYFFLTEMEASEISTSYEATWDYDWLYSSDLATWYDDVLSVYQTFSNDVGYLWSEQIVHHAQLQPGVKRVEYSDGSVIYINYNGEAVTFNDPVMGDEVTVEAQNYVVRKGAEG